MEYYALIMLSVCIFGGGFALQDIYRKKRGSNLKISMESAFIGSLAGLIVLLIINGFSFEFTGFTLLMALLAALNSILFTFCAFKSLDYINLSLFSLFSMLGGRGSCRALCLHPLWHRGPCRATFCSRQ